jgi:TetR/AcrR family transcriptional repressor of nem operon
MPLSKQHKARTRARIVRSAGRAFRDAGFGATGIDALMADAGLTRGGFYAHFASKEELFATVLRGDNGLARWLAGRDASTPERWRSRTLAVLRDYLDPDHLREVSRGCSFVALTADASRGSATVRSAYAGAFGELVAQLLRRHGETTEAALARATTHQREAAAQVATAAIGALIVAAALGDGAASRAALSGAWAIVRERMDG